MQIVDQSSQLVPLLALIPLYFAKATPIHLLLFSVLIIIRPNIIQNYCNAAISIILTIILILINLSEASLIIFKYIVYLFIDLAIVIYGRWKKEYCYLMIFGLC